QVLTIGARYRRETAYRHQPRLPAIGDERAFEQAVWPPRGLENGVVAADRFCRQNKSVATAEDEHMRTCRHQVSDRLAPGAIERTVIALPGRRKRMFIERNPRLCPGACCQELAGQRLRQIVLDPFPACGSWQVVLLRIRTRQDDERSRQALRNERVAFVCSNGIAARGHPGSGFRLWSDRRRG